MEKEGVIGPPLLAAHGARRFRGSDYFAPGAATPRVAALPPRVDFVFARAPGAPARARGFG